MAKEPENRYIIDPKQAQELIRLIEQNAAFTTAMQGSFDGIDATTIRTVLDIGCGPGGWMSQAALEHPDIQFHGIDISKSMIAYASAQAEVLGLKNVTFEHASVFPDPSFPSIYTSGETYDFIHARLCAAFMKNEDWVPLFQRCMDLLRPGGSSPINRD